jgi:hypothetical protein
MGLDAGAVLKGPFYVHIATSTITSRCGAIGDNRELRCYGCGDRVYQPLSAMCGQIILGKVAQRSQLWCIGNGEGGSVRANPKVDRADKARCHASRVERGHWSANHGARG